LQSSGDFHRLQFFAMGTDCCMDFGASSESQAREFRSHIFNWLAEFEGRYSRFRADSLVSKINSEAGKNPVAIDAETESLFTLCDWYHWLTRGVFDPTTLPLQLLWDYHRPRSALPSDEEVRNTRQLCNWREVRREAGSIFLPRPGMAIDLGGIGKEYAVDRTIEMARERGITNILVDFGHDLRVCGQPPEHGPWRIGLEDPRDHDKCWGGVAVQDRAVCSSGNYLRFIEIDGKRYGHIVDPRVGLPVANNTLSATAIATTCTEAGILSTVAFILGGRDGVDFIQNAPQAEGCVWIEQGCLTTGGFHRYVIKS
jgi:thiamine biosynthesis lipoprotein